MTQAAFRKAEFGPVDIERRPLPDGSTLLRSRVPLGDYPRVLTERLFEWAESHPDRPFLARRPSPGAPFRIVTYGEAWRETQRIGQALLDRGLSAERPVAVLSENSLERHCMSVSRSPPCLQRTVSCPRTTASCGTS
jgi:feruloyl-CoA synthase